ncbi:MAG: hypothetical protein ABIG44_15060 [Planctomycetota bacterium]
MSKKPCRGAGHQKLPESLSWALKYLPNYFSERPCQFHVELMRDLESGQSRLTAWVAPRGHAKSTCAAFAYPLWCLYEQKRRNIVIITHESSLARQFVRDIRTELESNELLLAAYGNVCEKAPAPAESEQRTIRRSRPKWSEDMIVTGTGVTLQAKSTGGSLRGTRTGPNRPDLIICDDIEKDEHVATPEGRRKLERWLQRVVLPALAPDGQLLVLGSLLHYDSLLANLRDRQRFPRWHYRVYRAIEATAGRDGQFRRQALWPARWSLARLDEERERVGTLAFEQEYMANPVDDSLRVFRPEWLQRYDPAELDLCRERLVTLMAVDPATGVSSGDYFAIWVGQIDQSTGVIYTRELSLARIGIVQQVKAIVAAFERWQPVRIGIETVAYQVALKEILEDYGLRHGHYFPTVSIQTVANKKARIEGSSPFYENGTFRLPPDLDSVAEAQFLHFPKASHDDAPDVCAMGIELARKLRSGRRVEGVTLQQGTSYKGGW